MAEHIAIEQGRPPWQPAEDAELVEVLHQYDMPLIGVIRHGTSLHLFRCIEGHTEASQLWAYTPLSLKSSIGSGLTTATSIPSSRS